MDFYDYMYGFRPYVSAAARRAQAARELLKLRKQGRTITPVTIEGRKIGKTFWGKAWCDNLERYGDFANRLPRGRTYARNGSVVDLQVAPGVVTALVSGSALYEVKVTIEPVPRARWRAVCADCSGGIDSLVELLQGRLSSAVMTRLCAEGIGLFPSPKEILFTCSCPDWASMCKHIAAALYGIGARLDHQPELLFTLRKVDQQDLLADAGSRPKDGAPGTRVLESDDLAGMFGIEIAPEAPAPKRTSPDRGSKKRSAGSGTTPPPVKARKKPKTARPVKDSRPPKPTVITAGSRRNLTPAMRFALSERVRKYWAERRTQAKKRGRSGS